MLWASGSQIDSKYSGKLLARGMITHNGSVKIVVCQPAIGPGLLLTRLSI